MWNERQLIYLAGIIDGEGTFYIGRKFNHRIVVVNTDERIIRWLRDNIGGLVYSRKNVKNPTWKIKYEWIIERAKVTEITKAILPFLVGKKEQAEVMIKFRESFTRTRGNRKSVPKEILNFRAQCYEDMKKFNHRVPLPI